MSDKLRALISEKETLAQEGNTLKLERGPLLSKLKELESKISLMQQDQEELKAENERILKQKEEAEARSQQESTEKGALVSEKSKLLSELEAVQAQLLKVAQENEALRSLELILFQRLEELQASKDAMDLACQKRDREWEELENYQKRLLEEKDAVLKDKDDVIQKLGSSCEALAREQRELQQQVSALAAERDSALGELLALQDRHKALEEELGRVLQGLQEEKEMLLKGTEKLQVSLDKAVSENQVLKVRGEEMQTQLTKAMKDTVELQNSLENLTCLLEEMKASRETLSLECKQLHQEKEALSSSEQRLLAEKEQLLNENQATAEKLAKASADAELCERICTEKMNKLTLEKESVLQKSLQFEKHNEALLQEKKELETKYLELLDANKSCAKAVSDLKRERELDLSSRNALAQENATLRDSIEALKGELGKKTVENQELMACKCDLSNLLKEAQDAKRALEVALAAASHTERVLSSSLDACSIARERDELQEECQKLNREVALMKETLTMEKEARKLDEKSFLLGRTELQKNICCLENELGELREKNKILAEKALFIQEKEKCKMKLVEIMSEEKVLSAKKEQVTASMERLRNAFASVTKSAAEFRGVHSCIARKMDVLQHEMELMEKEGAEYLQDLDSLRNEQKSLLISLKGLLNKMGKFFQDYYRLCDEVKLLEKTNSDLSDKLLESQGQNQMLQEQMNNLILKVKEIETLQAQAVVQEPEVFKFKVKSQVCVWFY
uniref:trichohyalin-like n=1 Tax=Lonchura striata TaxID=40157 RepID=UPI000B4CDF66|nr:trichohyalin-like [Lonchura striata domestica]